MLTKITDKYYCYDPFHSQPLFTTNLKNVSQFTAVIRGGAALQTNRPISSPDQMTLSGAGSRLPPKSLSTPSLARSRSIVLRSPFTPLVVANRYTPSPTPSSNNAILCAVNCYVFYPLHDQSNVGTRSPRLYLRVHRPTPAAPPVG